MAYVAIVLAAGRSTRFGGTKLDAPVGSCSVLEGALAAALAAPAERVLLVVRPSQATSPAPRVERIEVESEAMSESLRAGIAAAQGADGAFVFLGDMPLVPHHLAHDLLDRIGSAVAAVPVHDDAPGHPVLLARAGFGLVHELRGDVGLVRILRDRADVVRLATDDLGATLDVDTPADIAAAQRLLDKRERR